MGNKTFIQIYAYNENPRATAMQLLAFLQQGG